MAGIIKPEFPEDAVLITSRTMLSRLWFTLSPSLSNFFYAALARYQEIYGVEIYSFVLMSNHYHLIARFPRCNRAQFERDFNSILARSLKYYVPLFPGGKLWGRPYRFQLLPLKEDVKKYFLYTILNATTSGITKDPLAGGRANALRVIRNGGKETFNWFNRTAYNNAKRKNPNVNKLNYYTEHTLVISRLPGYEDFDELEYLQAIEKIVEKRRKEVLAERKAENKGFLGVKKLLRQAAGTYPYHTKKSHRQSYNPLVLSICVKTFQIYIEKYMALVNAYAIASRNFRNGDKSTTFPDLCYMPSRLVRATQEIS